MFREQINKKVTTARESSEDTIHPLTDNERNALRYTAGYICRHLRKQLERSNHELKEELVLCLMDLTTQKDPDASNTDEQSWESYFLKVIYYILLFTFCKSNALQLHIT